MSCCIIFLKISRSKRSDRSDRSCSRGYISAAGPKIRRILFPPTSNLCFLFLEELCAYTPGPPRPKAYTRTDVRSATLPRARKRWALRAQRFTRTRAYASTCEPRMATHIRATTSTCVLCAPVYSSSACGARAPQARSSSKRSRAPIAREEKAGRSPAFGRARGSRFSASEARSASYTRRRA